MSNSVNPHAITVLGPVAVEQLGITLVHEHLFIDLRNQFTVFTDPEKRRLSQEKLALSNIGVVRRNPYAVLDNLVLDDFDLAAEEANRFVQLGGQTIVDCTSIGIHRSPERLQALEKATGLNVIAGCGYYTYDTHPFAMSSWSVAELAQQMIRDLTVGIDGTRVRAGIIGEIGTSDPIHPNERKCLLAAAITHQATGAAIYVHTYPWGRAGLEAAQRLVAEGVESQKIVICHLDVEFDLNYLHSLLDLGVCLGFDNFGKEFYIDPDDRGFAGGIFARDLERVQVIRQLVTRGYETQILIANDICLKSMLHAYGGWGYDHILRHIVPMLRHEGVPQSAIDTFLIHNPRRLLTQTPK
jgi:phosphotriesterase-related protein